MYVRAVGGEEGRRQVSADRGGQPRWSRRGHEIVFRRGAAVLAASFDPATGEVGAPAELFRKADAGRLDGGKSLGYDVSPDGSRFLPSTPVVRPGAQPVVVIIHWLDDLKARIPR